MRVTIAELERVLAARRPIFVVYATPEYDEFEDVGVLPGHFSVTRAGAEERLTLDAEITIEQCLALYARHGWFIRPYSKLSPWWLRLAEHFDHNRAESHNVLKAFCGRTPKLRAARGCVEEAYREKSMSRDDRERIVASRTCSARALKELRDRQRDPASWMAAADWYLEGGRHPAEWMGDGYDGTESLLICVADVDAHIEDAKAVYGMFQKVAADKVELLKDYLPWGKCAFPVFESGRGVVRRESHTVFPFPAAAAVAHFLQLPLRKHVVGLTAGFEVTNQHPAGWTEFDASAC